MKLRRPTQILGLVLLTLMVSAWGGCSWFQKADGTKTTPLEYAKIADKAASDSWKEVVRTFAQARLGAEKAELAGKPLVAGQITLAQWSSFTALDTKVLASGRTLTSAIRAAEAGTGKADLTVLTNELLKLFTDATNLATAFGLKIPLLPQPTKTAALPLPFMLAALPAGLALAQRRRLPPIAGGAGVDPAMVLSITSGMIGAGGPLVADWVTSNPGDQAKAEAAAALAAAFLAGFAKVLPGIMEGTRDPSSINLDDLWDESAQQALDRMRREQG